MPPPYDNDGNGGSQNGNQNNIHSLTEEINFQKALLLSIEDEGDVEDPDEAKEAIRNEIKTLNKKLDQMVNKDGSAASSSSKSAGRQPNGRMDSPDDSDLDRDPFSRNRRNTFHKHRHNEFLAISSDSEIESTNAGSNHLQNNPKVNSEDSSRPKSRKQDLPQALSSTASTPISSVNCSLGPTKMDLPTRKRSNSHLGIMDSITNNKSRRTTPSPHPTRSATPMTASSGDEVYDSTFFTNSQQAFNAKCEQEKADEEFARLLEAEMNAPSPLIFGRPFVTNPHGTQASIGASSGGNPFWKPEPKSEPKWEQKPGHKFEFNDRHMNNIPTFGVPTMTGIPGAFDGVPYEDDSDCEIIEPSAFRDNGRNANVKPENKPEINSVQRAIWGNMKVPSWTSPPSKPPNGYIPAFGSVYSTQPADFFDARMPGAYPSGSMHDPAKHLGYFADGNGNGDAIKELEFSDDQFESDGEIDAILRRNMENGLDLLGNPLDEQMQEQYNYVINDPRKTDEDVRNLLSNIRPDEELPKEDREGTPEGMAYPLYEHQKLALTWLKKQETGSNKGGILADDMGLGKTISTLALMVSRPSENRGKKTNLIVAPVALIRQWEREIKLKLKPAARLSVLNMHAKKKCSWDTIRGYDVVLTTYGSLGAEFKRLEKFELKKANEKQKPSHYEMNKLFPLFSPGSIFHRIILDEAQCIKNKGTLASRACYRLSATYRLVLTGTPMMNNAGELYSLVNFLRIKPYNEWTRWQNHFRVLSKAGGRGGDPKKALQRLQILLKAILLRRTKTSLIDGQPIINLPPKTEEVQHVVFDEEEQAFYNALETKTKLVFNKYMKAGTVGKNYSNVLVLLLRLRQACCHPHLIQDFETAPSAMNADAMIELANGLSEEVIARIRDTDGNFECPICYDAVLNPSILIPCGHDMCSECLSRVSDQADADNQANDNHDASKCPTCRAVIDMKKVIDYSTFRKVHQQSEADIETASEHSDSEESDSDSDTASDLDSDEEDSGEDVDSDGDLANFVVPDGVEDSDDEDVVAKGKGKEKEKDALIFDPIEDSDSDVITAKSKFKPKVEKVEKSKRKRTSKDKGKGKEKKNKKEHLSLAMLKTEANKSIKGRIKYKKYLRKHWQPSAKVTKCVELLQQFQDDGQKTIIFSQFVSLLDLLQVPIEKNGWPVERYDGSMSAEARNDAIMRFTDKPNTKIMLISLKAGNAGLNLVAASRVIILDPFWNPFIELQAVDRAYRIGQQKSVEVHRILIQSTVEDRIIELQRQKKELVDAALDEGASKSVGKLGVQQLAFLFNG